MVASASLVRYVCCGRLNFCSLLCRHATRVRVRAQAALALSLNHARLPATLCLLDFFASVHGFFPPLFTRVQLQRIITRLWVAPATEDEALALKDTIHLFTVLVLCTRPDGAPPLEALSGDIGDQRTAATNLLLHEQHHAPNPVLVALKLASHCRDAMALNARDRAISEQLSTAANLLENVASGVLHGAVRATIERDEMKKTFNPWVTGKRALEPRVARDFFTTSTLHHAAEHELKVFVSNPFIYSHLQDLFWPEPPSGGIGNTPSTTPGDAGSLLAIASEVKPGGAGGVVGTSRRQLLRMSTSRNVMIPMSADVNPSGPGDEAALSPLLRWVRDACTYAALLLAHVLVLPVLLVIPRHWEVAIEDQQRQMVTSRQIPFGIIWFFPAGHIALWTAATTALAYLLTILPPPVIDDAVGRSSGSAALALVLGSHHDALLFFYLLGWCVFELQDLLSTNARATYFRDVFNMVDLALIVGMCLTFVTRLATPDNLYLTLPCQAATAMFAWLRLLQVLYIFPTTGPLLIMTIRMFRDLYQFLILAAFVIIAFAAAFHVLLNGEAVVEAWEAAASTPRASVSPSASEVLATASLEPPAASDRRMLKGGGSIAMGVHLGGRMPDGSRDPITFGAVIRLMLEGTLTGEPDRIMGLHSGADHALASFTWSTMALFGVVVVLLLLNLLIARFAKTFDIVYENVDANFKVAFARIVLKGGAHELVPPPFNLVRRAVLFLYTVVGQLVRRLPCRIAYLPLLEEDDDEELSEHGLSREEVGRIWEFMRKASSQQVQLYPAMVEKWVVRHQHDVASEDRWRTAITQQLALISAQVKDIHGDQESSRGRLDSAAQDEVATARAEAAAAQADSSNARRELEALKLQLLELRAQQPRSQRSQRGTKTTSFADSSTRPRDGSSADGAGGTQSPPLEASCVSA